MNSLDSVRRHSDGPRRVSILGSTGSVGQNTVDLLLRNPKGFEVEALTANRNPGRLAEQACALRARFVAIGDPIHYLALKDALAGTGIEAASGVEALAEAALRPADWVMAGIVGAAGQKKGQSSKGQGTAVSRCHGRTISKRADRFATPAQCMSSFVYPKHQTLCYCEAV